MCLSVSPGGAVVVSAPYASATESVERFVREHMLWIERAVQKMMGYVPMPEHGRTAYLKHREAARALVCQKILKWNQIYHFAHGRIAIKNSKRTWGSCSHKNNLNFSYAIVFLPPHLADYLVVHELCHLKEHNHSSAFWRLIESELPNYRELRKELRTYILK